MGIIDDTPDGPRYDKTPVASRWSDAPLLRDDIVAGLHRYGYAPGGYMGICSGCKQEMIADKRASSCSLCAIASALFEAKQMDVVYGLTELFGAATGGPWTYTHDEANHDAAAVQMARFGPSAASFRTDADAKFVAAAREALAPILQLRLERLQKAREMMGRG